MDVSQVDQKMESLKFLLENDDHFTKLFGFSIESHIFKRRDFATKMLEDAGMDFKLKSLILRIFQLESSC